MVFGFYGGRERTRPWALDVLNALGSLYRANGFQ